MSRSAGERPDDDIEKGGAADLDTARFRQVLGHFATGVTVVTGADRDGPVGFTCQAFCSLSLEPPLVIVAPGKTSESWPRIEATGVFCVNILGQDQEDLCRVFATKGPHKFDGVGWKHGILGVPVLSDVLAWVECRLQTTHDGGDHLVAIGRVEQTGVAHGLPLLFYRGGFGRFEA